MSEVALDIYTHLDEQRLGDFLNLVLRLLDGRVVAPVDVYPLVNRVTELIRSFAHMQWRDKAHGLDGIREPSDCSEGGRVITGRYIPPELPACHA